MLPEVFPQQTSNPCPYDDFTSKYETWRARSAKSNYAGRAQKGRIRFKTTFVRHLDCPAR